MGPPGGSSERVLKVIGSVLGVTAAVVGFASIKNVDRLLGYLLLALFFIVALVWPGPRFWTEWKEAGRGEKEKRRKAKAGRKLGILWIVCILLASGSAVELVRARASPPQILGLAGSWTPDNPAVGDHLELTAQAKDTAHRSLTFVWTGVGRSCGSDERAGTACFLLGQSGRFSFTVTASDSAGLTSMPQSYSITVGPPSLVVAYVLDASARMAAGFGPMSRAEATKQFVSALDSHLRLSWETTLRSFGGPHANSSSAPGGSDECDASTRGVGIAPEAANQRAVGSFLNGYLQRRGGVAAPLVTGLSEEFSDLLAGQDGGVKKSVLFVLTGGSDTCRALAALATEANLQLLQSSGEKVTIALYGERVDPGTQDQLGALRSVLSPYGIHVYLHFPRTAAELAAESQQVIAQLISGQLIPG